MPKSAIILSIIRAARRAAKTNAATRAAMNSVARVIASSRAGASLVKAVTEPLNISDNDYHEWLRQYEAGAQNDAAQIKSHISTFDQKPLISIVMPVFNPNIEHFKLAIDSVRRQLYEFWELCIVDDASSDLSAWTYINEVKSLDPRIRAVRRDDNGNISLASNQALSMSSGSYITFLDHDDALDERALYYVAEFINTDTSAVIIYTDEDKIDEKGKRYEPYFKTDWDPELVLAQNLANHLCVYRRDAILEVGGLRPGLEGAQDYDLLLRVSAKSSATRIRHIPVVLYHWRQGRGRSSFSQANAQRCADAAVQAVRDHLAATAQSNAAACADPGAPGWISIRRTAPDPAPKVSIIIPTRDRSALLSQCVESLQERTDYANYEILIANNDSKEPETLRLFERLSAHSRISVIDTPGQFNFSGINNRIAAQASGDIFLFLNNDIIVTQSSWLGEMVAQAARPTVGAVGAKLLYPDGRIQHAGVTLGVGVDHQVGKNTYCGAPSNFRGYSNFLQVARTVSAVTAACMACRREVFVRVGGFDEIHLAVAFNDLDFCLKVREIGLNVIWTPRAALIHLESESRGPDTRANNVARFTAEARWMRTRWGRQLDNDPFYNPNLDRSIGDFRLAYPPKPYQPWRQSDAPPSP